MNPVDLPLAATRLEQVYLLERDAGLLCRILGLYAARGLDMLQVEYAYAAQQVMTLRVAVDRLADNEDTVRVLVGKASTFIGVLAACEQADDARRTASSMATAGLASARP